MLIFTCIIILKYWGKKYKGLSIFLVVMILFGLFILVKKVYNYFNNGDSVKQTEEWVNVLDFSNILEMDKKGVLGSYPEVTLISYIDGEVLSLNVTTGDLVEEYQILMLIDSPNKKSSDYDVWETIETMYENYDEIEKEYKEFQIENGSKIKQLEKQLFNDQNALIQAMELDDKEGRKILEDEIEKTSSEYENLRIKKEELENNLNSLDNEIKLIRNETDKYYYELEKQTPRAPFKGVIGGIYKNEGEAVNDGDDLITIINNNFTPEILVSLDFDEYLLTKDLTGVSIIIKNENRGDLYYDGEIYTRSPILNNEGKYTLTVKVIGDNIPDLILDDDNSEISIIFTINSTSSWFPDRCFKKIGKDKGILILRDGDIIVDKEVGIKSKWDDWINIDQLGLYGLEKEKEIDGIQLCVEDWNKGVIKENDVDIIDWFNEFETIEDFCAEYIKVNPMYGENRNMAIVSELGGPGEMIEVLCDVE